jgi:hypothetical protein
MPQGQFKPSLEQQVSDLQRRLELIERKPQLPLYGTMESATTALIDGASTNVPCVPAYVGVLTGDRVLMQTVAGGGLVAIPSFDPTGHLMTVEFTGPPSTGTTWDLTHNLGSRHVWVFMWDASTHEPLIGYWVPKTGSELIASTVTFGASTTANTVVAKVIG